MDNRCELCGDKLESDARIYCCTCEDMYEVYQDDDTSVTDQQLFGVVYDFDPNKIELY